VGSRSENDQIAHYPSPIVFSSQPFFLIPNRLLLSPSQTLPYTLPRRRQPAQAATTGQAARLQRVCGRGKRGSPGRGHTRTGLPLAWAAGARRGPQEAERASPPARAWAAGVGAAPQDGLRAHIAVFYL